jgi:hypothetical protein
MTQTPKGRDMSEIISDVPFEAYLIALT